MHKIDFLKEMVEALASAKKCSEQLEHLLTEAQKHGTPSPELIHEINAVNKTCAEEMQRYLKAYHEYYGTVVG